MADAVAYPRITFKQNAVWRRQAARCFDDLATDLEAGELPVPRCVGEEMALRLMLSWARDTAADDQELLAQTVAGLPKHREDYDWDMLFEWLFQDDDLSTLFNPEEDGIEDPDAATNQFLGMGDYRPHAWFDWFLNVDPRDGRRLFRR